MRPLYLTIFILSLSGCIRSRWAGTDHLIAEATLCVADYDSTTPALDAAYTELSQHRESRLDIERSEGEYADFVMELTEIAMDKESNPWKWIDCCWGFVSLAIEYDIVKSTVLDKLTDQRLLYIRESMPPDGPPIARVQLLPLFAGYEDRILIVESHGSNRVRSEVRIPAYALGVTPRKHATVDLAMPDSTGKISISVIIQTEDEQVPQIIYQRQFDRVFCFDEASCADFMKPSQAILESSIDWKQSQIFQLAGEATGYPNKWSTKGLAVRLPFSTPDNLGIGVHVTLFRNGEAIATARTALWNGFVLQPGLYHLRWSWTSIDTIPIVDIAQDFLELEIASDSRIAWSIPFTTEYWNGRARYFVNQVFDIGSLGLRGMESLDLMD